MRIFGKRPAYAPTLGVVEYVLVLAAVIGLALALGLDAVFETDVWQMIMRPQ
ncbi:MAG: hypothetical protein AAF871_05460 [Pseudomonadota bacterium]